LIDVYEKRLPLLCIVLVNRCAAMTGKQPSPDPLPYIRWAAPEICRADDIPSLTRVIRHVDRPVTMIVEGTCPAGAQHQMIPINKPGVNR
jgi:indolepyruvate ferredoxin oxidoreductase alpha subunit